MGTLKTYSISRWFWLLPMAVTVILIVYYQQPYAFGSKVFMAVLCLFGWWVSLSIPIKIEIEHDHSVIFQGVLRKTRIKIVDISAIERGGKTTALRHSGRRIEIPNIIKNIEGLLEELHRLNPSVIEDVSQLAKFGQSPTKVILLIVLSVALALIIAALAIYFPAVGKFFRGSTSKIPTLKIAGFTASKERGMSNETE